MVEGKIGFVEVISKLALIQSATLYEMESKEIIDQITIEFGDLIAHDLSINFQTRKTEVHFGESITENSKSVKKMIFENVVWQEFSEFDFCNIFNTIEIDNDFKTFKEKHTKYFDKMQNYISQEDLDEIKATENKYYTFIQSAGFNCFIITKSELKINVTD